MKVRYLLAAAISLASTATASLVPVGPVPFSGTGIGAVNTVLTVGNKPTESGCVARGPAGDVLGGAACPAGFTGGDEKTGASQTQTRTISELGLTTATDLRIVLNINESTGNSVSMTNLVLTIFDPGGTVLFTSGAFTPPTFPMLHSPGTTVGYVFELDSVQAAQAQLVFAGTNRVGLAANLTNTTAGNETFFVADVTAIGTPLFGADMAITKTATPSAIAGTNATYTLNVINNGPEAAVNAVVTDVLPAGTRFVSLAAQAGWACTAPPVGSGGTINCTKASVAIGESATFTATVGICPEVTCGTVISNSATVSSTTIDPVTANGTSTATTSVQAQSNLGITKNASSASVNAGGTLIYTLNVTNAGPSNSAGTSVIDTLPAGFTAVNVVTTSGTCSGSGTATVNCNLGIIGAPGQCVTALPTAATVTITAQASPLAPPAVYTNTATVSTTNCLPDPNLANNTATITTTIPASPVGADVAITKSAPATAVAGANVTYSLDVTNGGPTAAADVVVTDSLPAETRFVSLNAPAGWSCTTPAVGATGTITCTKTSMAVAETAVFTVSARVCPETACGTTITNTATAASSTSDPLLANNTSTTNVTIQAQSDLAITKNASVAAVPPGGALFYTLNVTNAGPSNSVGTAVVDVLPPGFTATSAVSSVGTCSGTTSVTCVLGTLGAANQCATAFASAATITINVQVAPTVTGGTVMNTATVTTGNCLGDPNAANNTATVATAILAPVVGAPTLSELGLFVFAALLLLAGLYFTRE
jgi:uncharacterized repeat protein (TIGR01451 family)